jgi:hypothetical protein
MAHQNSFTINIDRQKNPHIALDSNQQYHRFLLSLQKLSVHSISFIGDEDDSPIVPPS